jgi:hypothetical protein
MERIQFNMKGCLIATFWVAIWFAAIRFDSPGKSSIWCAWIFLIVCAPAAATGALAGHPTLGLLCGATSGLAFAAWAAFS